MFTLAEKRKNSQDKAQEEEKEGKFILRNYLEYFYNLFVKVEGDKSLQSRVS